MRDSHPVSQQPVMADNHPDDPSEREGEASGSVVSEESVPTSHQRGGAITRLASMRTSGLLAAIVVTMIVFWALNPLFLSSTNLLGLVRSMGTFTIVALGLTLVLVSGEIDLSVGAVYGLCAMVTGVLWVRLDLPLVVALVLALGVAVAVGALNAFFTAVVRVPSFITTLGMLSLAQGVTFLISGQSSISASSRLGTEFTVFKTLGAYRLPLNTPVHIVWMIAVAIVVGYILHRTLFGFRLAAIGGNRDAARTSGLPVRRYTFWVFMLSGFCAGLAGILDFSFIGSTNPTAGTSLTFPVFAAVIIGGASLSGGRGSVVGTLTGAFLLTMLSNGLSLLGVGTFAQLIFVGGVTIGAVAIDGWATRRADPSRTLQM